MTVQHVVEIVIIAVVIFTAVRLFMKGHDCRKIAISLIDPAKRVG